MSEYFRYNLEQLKMFGEIDFIVIKDLYDIYTGDSLNSSLKGFVVTVKYKEDNINKKMISFIPPQNKCFVNGRYLTLDNIEFNNTIDKLLPYLKFNDYHNNSRLSTKDLKEIKIIELDWNSDKEPYKYLLSLNDIEIFKIHNTTNISILHNKILYMLNYKHFSHKLRNDLQGYMAYFNGYEKYHNYHYNIILHILNKIKNEIKIDITKGITYNDKLYKNLEEIFMDFNLLSKALEEIDFNSL